MDYARSSVVYKELRAALGPWCKERGYKRRPGTEPGWFREPGGGSGFWFRVNPWGGGTLGGSSFYGNVEAGVPGAVQRQVDFSHCLTQAELDELRWIQTKINRRRPSFPERDAWLREDSRVGALTREQYSGNESPYALGDFVTFGYYSSEDVREHCGFILRRLPDVLARFRDGHVANPRTAP